MNSKMTTNSQLSTEPKNKNKKKVSKQLEQEQKHRNGDHLEAYQWGGGRWRREENVQGIRSIIGRCKLDGGGELKNSIGNGEAKEFICMAHGYELRRDCWRE